jgi:hypothetical protein
LATARLRGKPLPECVCRDDDSLAAPGRFSPVGNLRGTLTGGSMLIERMIVLLLNWSLRKMDLVAQALRLLHQHTHAGGDQAAPAALF